MRLRKLIIEVWGGSTAALTKAMGWETASFASRLISESPGNQKNIGSRMARDIEKAAGKPKYTLDTPAWADDGTAIRAVDEPVSHWVVPPQMPRGVPLIGHVIANPTEDGYFDDMGFPPGAGEALIPWGTTDPLAYAVRVKGDSMYPRYRPGEILVVEPNAAVIPGEDVIVRMKDGRKMVKRLLFQRAGEVELGSINERHQPITLSLESIESIQLVAGSVRRGAER
jgi:phage repressor protein C with HTH and peptisase S24 domain